MNVFVAQPEFRGGLCDGRPSRPMRVHLPRIGSGKFTDRPVDRFEQLALADRIGTHRLVADPDEADLVLFTQCNMVDWRLSAIRNHPTARRYWRKVRVYDERDRPWLSFPGVYVSAPRRTFDDRRQAAWGYARIPDISLSTREPDLLYSFVGSRTAPCRERVLQLRHPDAIVEAVENFMFWDTDSPGHARQRARFAGLVSRSKFVLCPRGRGTSSIRVYEVLAAGRVPVVIADEWVPPKGPDWSACIVRCAEEQVDQLPGMLDRVSSDWKPMAEAARTTYAEFFAPNVAFERVIGLCSSVTGNESRVGLAMKSLSAALAERRAE